MRSAAYSLFATILLLVPIAAVPLMAVFGIPQFAPAVASPLDDLEDESSNRPAKTRARSTAKSQRRDEPDFELLESDWEEPVAEQRRPLRRSRSGGAVRQPVWSDAAEHAESNEGRATAAIRRTSGPPPRKSLSEDEEQPFTDDTAPIQPVNFESEPQEVPLRQFPDETELSDIRQASYESAAIDEPPAAIPPGFRRQRPGAAESAEKSGDKNPASRARRSAPTSPPLTWSQAVERLNRLGIRTFRLDQPRPGEFVFTCGYTPNNAPHITRRFEADADDPLKAVEKVLAQVEEAAQQRVPIAPRANDAVSDRRSAR